MTDRLTTYLEGAGAVFLAETESLPSVGGAYLLVLDLHRPVRLAIDKLGMPRLAPGRYFYAGSAYGPGGLRARIARHMTSARKGVLRWHIDHLLAVARVRGAWILADGSECALFAAAVSAGDFGIPIPRFGSSDCRRCPSHLLGPVTAGRSTEEDKAQGD